MDTLCAQQLLPFSDDSFETLQVLLSWPVDACSECSDEPAHPRSLAWHAKRRNLVEVFAKMKVSTPPLDSCASILKNNFTR